MRPLCFTDERPQHSVHVTWPVDGVTPYSCEDEAQSDADDTQGSEPEKTRRKAACLVLHQAESECGDERTDIGEEIRETGRGTRHALAEHFHRNQEQRTEIELHEYRIHCNDRQQ